MQRASIVLHAPEGPTSSRLWPPAAATSSARRAASGRRPRRGRSRPPRSSARRSLTACTIWSIQPQSWPRARMLAAHSLHRSTSPSSHVNVSGSLTRPISAIRSSRGLLTIRPAP